MLGGFFRFLFPPYCLGCLNDGPSYCCQSCLKKIEIFYNSCPVCDYPSTPGRVCGWCLADTSLDGLYIAAPYDQPILPELLTAFKFEGITSLANELGSILSPLTTYLPKTFTLIPLPLSWWRFQERGFNQSELLARSAIKIPSLRLRGGILRRRWSFRQSKLSSLERARNVRGTFSCLKPELVKDEIIILVDDLYTTGATLNEAARVLKTAGAKKIIGLVLAKG